MAISELGPVAYVTMLGVKKLGLEAYGSAVYREISDTQWAPSLAHTYVTLHRLEGRGLLTSSSSGTVPKRGGRARRLYAMTDLGSEAFHRTTAALSGFPHEDA